MNIELGKYVLQKCEKSYCGHCETLLSLLAPREPTSPGDPPIFYLCTSCGRISQAGVGEVAPPCLDMDCSPTPPARVPPAEWQCRPPKQGEMVWNGLKIHGNAVELCPCDHAGDHWVLVPLKPGLDKRLLKLPACKCSGCGNKIIIGDEGSCVCTGCDKLFCAICTKKFDDGLYCVECQVGGKCQRP